MRSYIARVLVEHRLTPEPHNYSSFSEFIILGRFDLPKGLEFSRLFFDERSDILERILSSISHKINDQYVNANGECVDIIVREISKIEDTDLEFPEQDDLYEVDERLYTFGERIRFEDFKKRYTFGRDSD